MAPASARRRPSALRQFLTALVPLGAGVWLLWKTPTPEAGAPDEAVAPGGRAGPAADAGREGARRPSASVVIPARDEEANLATLLRSLSSQERPPEEVVVVDDHSSDATARIAEGWGARVLTAAALPTGWVGKAWAAHQGAEAASGDVLVFLDADVALSPGALGSLLGLRERLGGLVSVQPAHVPGSLPEQLSAVCNVVALMGTGAFVPWPRRMPDMAFGPCMVISAADYRAAGGHAHPEVRNHVAEDAAIARRARALGLPVAVLAGGRSVRFRMYPGGVGALVEGWSKMLGEGARRSHPAVAAAVSVWVGGAIVGAVGGVRALAPGPLGSRRRLAGIAVYVAWAAEMRWLLGKVGRWRAVTAAAYPVPLAAFVGLSVRSLVLSLTGRPAHWRGRQVPPG